MDWKHFAECFDSMTCILSVEKKPDGGYGMIRIVTGNKAYIDTLALAAGGVDVGSEQKTEFIPNSPYTRYIPKDLNFEDVCYQCAVLKQPIHDCLRASRYPFDIKSFFLPMQTTCPFRACGWRQERSFSGSGPCPSDRPAAFPASALPTWRCSLFGCSRINNKKRAA